MITLILRILVSIAICVITYFWMWWLPIITFPLVMSIAGYMVKPRRPPKSRLHFEVTKFIFYLSMAIYIVSEIVIFQIKIGSWYGWIIGGIISFILSGVMAGAQQDSQGNV